MINDCVIDRIDEKAIDPLGNAFVTWILETNDARFFDDAIDRLDVKRVFLRHMSSEDGHWRVRFTAYDKDGTCITDKVCASAHTPANAAPHGART